MHMYVCMYVCMYVHTQVPKLMWLKENLPASWEAAVKVLDLADFMVYKSSGVDCRSLCTSVCKWSYLGHKASWYMRVCVCVSVSE